MTSNKKWGKKDVKINVKSETKSGKDGKIREQSTIKKDQKLEKKKLN